MPKIDFPLTFTQLVERDGIRLTVTKRHGHFPSQLTADGWAHNRFSVRLNRGGNASVLNVPSWKQGVGVEEDPAALDVLYNLITTAALLAESPTFIEWCDALGYGTDSIRANNLYKACNREAASLRRFLGDKFDDYMSCEVDW